MCCRQDAFTLNVLEVPQGSGSGFVWDKSGHIVTNFHVIRGESDLRASRAGRSAAGAATARAGARGEVRRAGRSTARAAAARTAAWQGWPWRRRCGRKRKMTGGARSS